MQHDPGDNFLSGEVPVSLQMKGLPLVGETACLSILRISVSVSAHDKSTAASLHGRCHFLNICRFRVVICVHKDNAFSGRLPQSVIAGGGHAAILFLDHDDSVVVASADDRPGSICRSVVDQDDLQIFVRLRQYRLEASLQILLRIVHGNDHRYFQLFVLDLPLLFCRVQNGTGRTLIQSCRLKFLDLRRKGWSPDSARRDIALHDAPRCDHAVAANMRVL